MNNNELNDITKILLINLSKIPFKFINDNDYPKKCLLSLVKFIKHSKI